MTKNLIIGLLTAGIIVLSVFLISEKGQKSYTGMKTIVRDTIYIHDTVFINHKSDPCIKNSSKSTVLKEKTEIINNPYKDADLTYKIIPSENNTFGYDILISGRAMIHQPNIPGLPGNEGFTSEKSARKVAELVIKKIRNNEMPPSVSMKELEQLETFK